MASRREMEERIVQKYGYFLSQNQVREFTGKGTHQTAVFCADIPFSRDGRKKSYFASDIAKKLCEQQQTAV